MTTTTSTLVCSLRDRLDPASAGHKAAALSMLLRHGFPVPAGVVLSADALEAARAAGGPLRPPEALIDRLAEAVATLGDAPLAVRSSGVEEDLDDASYAGLYTTVLDVQGRAGLASAVQEVWESASSERVDSYRPGDPSAPARMAVLVQPMVSALAAGVAFTADPVSGERGVVVVEAIVGVGERLVSGELTPGIWEVRDGVGTRRSGDGDVLTAAQAAAVAEVAASVAAFFGQPHDMEWALDASGVQVLQARPITALPEVPITPVPVAVEVPEGYWEREASHAPVPTMPFTRVFASSRSKHVGQMCREMGQLFDGIDFRDIGGWEYIRIVPIGGRDPKPLPGWATRLAFKIVPELRRRVARAESIFTEDPAGRLLDDWLSSWRPDIEQRVARLRDIDLGALTDGQLARHLREVLDTVDLGSNMHFRLHGAIAMAMSEFAFTCRDLLGWDDDHALQLLAGLSDRSTEPARALADVARTSGTPGFEAAFEEYLHVYGCRGLQYEVAEPNLEERPDLVLALVDDLLEHGLDLEPTGAELARRREQAVTAAHAALSDQADRAAFDKALQRAVEAYPVREDNEFLTVSAPLGLCRRAALEIGRRLAARSVIEVRDDVFFLEADEAMALVEKGGSGKALVLRRKGERAWVLAHPGPTAYGTPLPPPPMDALPPLARRTVEGFMWNTERIFGDPHGEGSRTAGTVTGIGASRGSYTGRVRIVLSEREFDRIEPGDVLVCPVTSPVWSVVFPRIGALVTDSGGTLSHPAIIAREYGIPAVVDTKNGTTELHDGQLVAVDGDAGVVTVVS